MPSFLLHKKSVDHPPRLTPKRINSYSSITERNLKNNYWIEVNGKIPF